MFSMAQVSLEVMTDRRALICVCVFAVSGVVVVSRSLLPSSGKVMDGACGSWPLSTAEDATRICYVWHVGSLVGSSLGLDELTESSIRMEGGRSDGMRPYLGYGKVNGVGNYLASNSEADLIVPTIASSQQEREGSRGPQQPYGVIVTR
ncbi:hypothetical protein QBC37DRAFT_395893 [Rhypophila decipiens]|uniref:Uncharacterized protein n=1 Tax=Rhypophila decipiens TaxID=261697 RepID=A0AAN6YF71_9PEZI|nr:hypothetical protein QBC37DRAFT_395893 [Rhypophila decipiens]